MGRIAKIVSGFTIVLGLFFAHDARATDTYGYPCSVIVDPNAYAYYGQYGTGTVTMYSQTHCAGTYLGYFDFYTTGATASAPTKMSENAFMTIVKLFQQAAISGDYHQTHVVSSGPQFMAAGF